MNKKAIILISIAILVLIAGMVFGPGWKEKRQEEFMKKLQKEEIFITKESLTKQKIEKQAWESIDTTNWKTYVDENYGFEIKHPWQWEFKDLGFVSASGGEIISIVIDENRNDTGMSIVRFKLNKKNPEEWFNYLGILNSPNKKITINNYSGLYIKEDTPTMFLRHSYYIFNKNSLVSLYFKEKNRDVNLKTGEIVETSFSEYLAKFEAMVYSIKFID